MENEFQKELIQKIFWDTHYERRFDNEFFLLMKTTPIFEDHRKLIADKFFQGDIMRASHWILEYLFIETPKNKATP